MIVCDSGSTCNMKHTLSCSVCGSTCKVSIYPVAVCVVHTQKEAYAQLQCVWSTCKRKHMPSCSVCGPLAKGSICPVAAYVDLLYTLWGSGPLPSPSTHLSPVPLSVSDWHIPWKTWAGIYGLRLCALDKQSKFYLSLRGWIKQSI